MPIYDPNGKRQVCTKCGWKNPMVEHSDCLIFSYQECPKCKGELEFRAVGSLESKMETLLNIFRK